MTQTGIPFVFMRGGTSRGPYFNRNDLPEHGQAAFPVLRWFDAITLAEQRAA